MLATYEVEVLIERVPRVVLLKLIGGEDLRDDAGQQHDE